MVRTVKSRAPGELYLTVSSALPAYIGLQQVQYLISKEPLQGKYNAPHVRTEAWQQLPGRQPPLHVLTASRHSVQACLVGRESWLSLTAIYLTKVSASRTSVTSLTCCTSSRAAARGSTSRPKVVEGAQMWLNLRLHMHADRRSA